LFFWREFFADFGALGPLPELLFFVDLGVGFFKGEPLVFDVEALGVEFSAAEAGDIGTELAEATPMGLGIILECQCRVEERMWVINFVLDGPVS